jgi:putative aldouronate transport system permease protein
MQVDITRTRTRRIMPMGFIREIVKNRQLYVVAIPGIAFLAIFSYIPMLGHLIAFERFQPVKGIWGSKWVGLDNFKFFSEGKIG